MQLYVTFTSEENSYGRATTQWFDGGNVEIFKVYYGDLIKITEVTEYKHIDTLCSLDSYYECLAKRFTHVTKTSNVTGMHCPFDVCAPFTLPFSDDEIPICKRNAENVCFKEVLSKLEEDQDKYCKKSCIVKQFGITKTSTVPLHLRKRGQTVFGYQFEAPKATRNQLSKQPFKNVKREVWVVTFTSLVGNVGGTLGMFIGFSFFMGFENLVAFMETFLSSMKTHVYQKQDQASPHQYQKCKKTKK